MLSYTRARSITSSRGGQFRLKWEEGNCGQVDSRRSVNPRNRNRDHGDLDRRYIYCRAFSAVCIAPVFIFCKDEPGIGSSEEIPGFSGESCPNVEHRLVV